MFSITFLFREVFMGVVSSKLFKVTVREEDVESIDNKNTIISSLTVTLKSLELTSILQECPLNNHNIRH